MDLFSSLKASHRESARPLAARMRPRNLDEYVGQEHFLGPGKLLRRMLLADRLNSLIFYGPPGCGKTALAHVIANQTKAKFVPMNAVSAGIKEVREVLTEARQLLEHDGKRTILFLDEMHRFNRNQQDVLLPDVEDGVIILVGATTQNPFFAVNTPLLSRSQIFIPGLRANLCWTDGGRAGGACARHGDPCGIDCRGDLGGVCAVRPDDPVGDWREPG